MPLENPSIPDASTADGSAGDSPPTATCMESWRAGTVEFGAPVLLASLGSPQTDRDPFVTADELTIFFATDRDPTQGSDVYVATRASRDAPFGAPQRENSLLSTPTEDTRFSMTADGLTAVVASKRAGTEGLSDLWLMTRANRTDPFTSFRQDLMSEVNSPGWELDPELSADGLRLYFSFEFPQELKVSERSTPTGAFGAPRLLGELNSDGVDDGDASLSPDELVIVFMSRRSGGGGSGSGSLEGDGVGDLWYATRATKNAPFGAPRHLASLNAPGVVDGDPSLSADGCRLYFASKRNGGNFELYVASMKP